MADVTIRYTCKLSGGFGSGPYYNVHYVKSTDPTSTHLIAQVTALKNFYDAIKAWYPIGITVTCADTAISWSDPIPALVSVPAQSVTGTDGSGYLSPQLALTVSWKTPFATRHSRGRSFIGPLGQAASTSSGTPVAAFTTALQTAANALIVNLAAAGTGASKQIVSTRLATQFPVTNAVVRSGSFHTQRRRALR